MHHLLSCVSCLRGNVNVFPGLLAPAGPVEKSIQQGFKMIQLGGDLGLLTGTVTKIVKDAKSKVNTNVK